MTVASYNLLTPEDTRWALLNWEWEIMSLFKLWCFGSSSRTRPACGRSATLIRIGGHNADLQAGMSVVSPEYPASLAALAYRNSVRLYPGADFRSQMSEVAERLQTLYQQGHSSECISQ